MKYTFLQVVISALTTAILVAGSIQAASANESNYKDAIVTQNQIRDFTDHPVHLGKAEQVFSVALEPVENIEDIAAIYEKDGGCD